MGSYCRDDKAFVNEMIRLSKNITKLYEQLMDAEFFHGKNSDEYRLIVRNIDLSTELEEDMRKTLYGSPDLLNLMKNELQYRNDPRNIEIFQSDPYAVSSLFYAQKCEEYDQLHDFGRILCTKELFLKKSYDPMVRSIMINGSLALLERKTYVKILDEEIASAEDEETKKMLIREKNETLSRSPALESWYFGFGRRDEAILVEDDEVMADVIDIDVELYRKYKRNYFYKIIDGVEELVLAENKSSKEALKIYRMNLLGALMNLDITEINEIYIEFYQHLFENSIPVETDSVKFIDEIYSKYPEYLKKMALRKID